MTDNNVRKLFKNRKPVPGKKDKAEKEMKEYAETAMNELLGWYGYDKMNTKDTQALNLSLFSSKSSAGCSARAAAVVGRRIEKRKYANDRTTVIGVDSVSSDASSSEDSNGTRFHSPVKREASSSPSNSNVTVPDGFECCGWCQTVANYSHFTFKMSNCDKVFCSEVCFTHYRRANFKRSKTCDWCRHVRHTVNYVDLQDGDTQYQFCSDKCLNQFKLDIFCQETKEHMEIHPHHNDPADGENSAAPLITPDLWLKNCNSPSSSSSEKSVCSSPPIDVTTMTTDSHPDKLVEIKIEPSNNSNSSSSSSSSSSDGSSIGNNINTNTTASTIDTCQTIVLDGNNDDDHHHHHQLDDDRRIKKQKRNSLFRKPKIKIRKSLQTSSSSGSPPVHNSALMNAAAIAGDMSTTPSREPQQSIVEFWSKLQNSKPPNVLLTNNQVTSNNSSPRLPFYLDFNPSSSSSLTPQSDLIRPHTSVQYHNNNHRHHPIFYSSSAHYPTTVRPSSAQQHSSTTIPSTSLRNPFALNNNNNNNNSSNLPVPPLLPIATHHPMLQHHHHHRHQSTSSHLQQPPPIPPRQPTNSENLPTTTTTTAGGNKSLLPPPILLIPHPIAIPIPIPIPLPIPIPIFLNRPNQFTAPTKANHENDAKKPDCSSTNIVGCDCERLRRTTSKNQDAATADKDLIAKNNFQTANSSSIAANTVVVTEIIPDLATAATSNNENSSTTVVTTGRSRKKRRMCAENNENVNNNNNNNSKYDSIKAS